MKTGKKSVCCVVGTRPEAIKMAPVILELRKRAGFDVSILATGQHTDMLYQALSFFGLVPDQDLKVMKEKQSLDYLTARIVEGVGEVFDRQRPDVVLVHGDTTTTFAAALSAFYRQIPIGHVEAGLRSGDLANPFPEEANRCLTDRLCSFWFPPTGRAADNLAREGIRGEDVLVTGNTVIDALFLTREKVSSGGLPDVFRNIPSEAPLALLTTHRRESWGAPLERTCRAARTLLADKTDLWMLVPMHRNPVVREVIQRILGDQERVVLCEPLSYPDFVWAMDRSRIILTDSGGVQEEASAMAKPILILRSVTERPEVLEAGSGILVGTDPEMILKTSLGFLNDPDYGQRLGLKFESPFGDGKASARIADFLEGGLFGLGQGA